MRKTLALAAVVAALVGSAWGQAPQANCPTPAWGSGSIPVCR